MIDDGLFHQPGSEAVCPYCKQPVSSTNWNLRELIETLCMANSHRIVARALRTAWPRYLPLDTLVTALYGHNREPEHAADTIRSYISRLRTQLRPFGWTVRCSRYEGYRFDRLDTKQ